MVYCLITINSLDSENGKMRLEKNLCGAKAL